jgi:rubrerythrin
MISKREWIATAEKEVAKFSAAPEGEQPATIKIYTKDSPKQTTRLLKAICPVCGYTVRVTKRWAEIGLPICPEDTEQFVLEIDTEAV